MNPFEKMKKKDQPAFAGQAPTGSYREDFFGLTKREYFAALAMQGICGDGVPRDHHSFKNTAIEAIAYADALITELSKEE